jgi:beta-lactamase class A
MSSYRPYRVYQPQVKAAAAQPAPVYRFSFKKSLAIGAIVLLVGLAFRIDMAAQAHARAAASAELARRAQAISKFQKQLNITLASDPAVSYEVAVTDSKLAKPTSYNEQTAADAASTAKILTAALYLNQVEKAQANLSQTIDGMSAKAALQLMINQSDDDAWLAFNEYLGHNALSGYASALDLNSYDVDTNTISAADMNRLIVLLAEGKLLNQAHTDLLMSYMQHTNYEDLISPAVDSRFNLYHKVGENADDVNDAAIIRAPGDTLFITIFTQGNNTYNWPHRAEIMQQVTRQAEQAYLD